VAPERSRLWLTGLVPLVLLAALVAVIVKLRPIDSVRGDFPPVEEIAFQRVILDEHGLAVEVLNDGPDPTTIAQVQIDDAYWQFTIEPAGALPHLGRASLRIPYPWVEAETHVIRLITSTGLAFDHEIAVAVATPRPSARSLWAMTLIGLFVGVLPVAFGLLWYPLVARLSQRALDFVLALTLGLLAFLFVDSTHEGLEAAAAMPGSYQGIAVFVFGALAAYLAIEALGRWLGRRVEAGGAAWVSALLVAIGIGLHNFAEGLAIGAAIALGEAALGTLLILGFTLHNVTEGLAIVAPLARQRVSLGRLVLLGVIGGVPTIAGTWLGAFVYSPLWATLFLALGAGAIAQVAVQIARSVAGESGIAHYLRRAPVLWGLGAGFLIMYATGMFV
jgi:zinc transporter ZupT